MMRPAKQEQALQDQLRVKYASERQPRVSFVRKQCSHVVFQRQPDAVVHQTHLQPQRVQEEHQQQQQQPLR
jgi:hypothetical protein